MRAFPTRSCVANDRIGRDIAMWKVCFSRARPAGFVATGERSHLVRVCITWTLHRYNTVNTVDTRPFAYFASHYWSIVIENDHYRASLSELGVSMLTITHNRIIQPSLCRQEPLLWHYSSALITIHPPAQHGTFDIWHFSIFAVQTEFTSPRSTVTRTTGESWESLQNVLHGVLLNRLSSLRSQ